MIYGLFAVYWFPFGWKLIPSELADLRVMRLVGSFGYYWLSDWAGFVRLAVSMLLAVIMWRRWQTQEASETYSMTQFRDPVQTISLFYVRSSSR